jgi:hypothetical protein
VIQILDSASGDMRGFSTQMLLTTQVDGRPVKALFSGDTIIDKAHWGDPALSRAWGRFALSLIDQHDNCELYWFLISQGYKTYRFLPLFFHEFYPRFDRPTPDWAAEILTTLAAQKFPRDFCRQAGVVRANAVQYRLRERVADLTPARLRDRHVRFFAERNLGHAGGDELCCLAPLTRGNFTAAAHRVIGLGQLAAGAV